MTGALARTLAETTLALVDIPSESRFEAAALDHVRAVMAAARVPLQLDTGSALVYAPEGAARFLAGHLDTVPAQGNLPGRIDDGRVHGLGAADMKGGVAVMLALAAARPDLGYLFFAREELPVKESALPEVFARSPHVRAAELVVMLEPTDGALEVGCLGNLNADLVFAGVAAHSARPWLGANAIHAAVHGLQQATRAGERRVAFGEAEYVEVLSVTGIAGGVARNVVPPECTALLNFRYAPDRTSAGAEERLRELVGEHGTLTIVSNAPSAPVPEGNAHVEALRAAGAAPVRAKQAWTPVAEFTERGIAAVNLGPGDPRSPTGPTSTCASTRSCAATSSWPPRELDPRSDHRLRRRCPAAPGGDGPACARRLRRRQGRGDRAAGPRPGRRDRPRPRRLGRAGGARHPRRPDRRDRRAHELPVRGRPARAAARRGRVVGAPLRRRARPGHPGSAHAGLEGGDLLAGPGRQGPGARGGRAHHAGLRDPRARRARGRARAARAAAPGRARLPARPRRDPVGAPRDPLAQLPEQPDRRRRAGRVLRRGGRALPPRRRGARLGRGLRRALLGRAAGLGARR